MKKIIPLSILLALSILLNAQNQMPLNPYPKTINISGSAEMEIVPDEIYVQADLREYKRKGGGKMDLETIKTSFLTACKSVGIADSVISIVSYSGDSYNYWVWKRKKDPEMYAGISYQVKFKDSKGMDALIEKLDDEATASFQVVRTSHSKIQEFRKQLKIEAVKQAKQKGIYLTDAIGEKLGDAITINEPNEFTDDFVLNKVSNNALKEIKTGDTGNAGDNPVIDFKKIKLKYEVAIVFALK